MKNFKEYYHAIIPRWVVYPGDQKYALNDEITVIPLDLISQLVGTGLNVQKNSAT
jgi:hypothetical protein